MNTNKEYWSLGMLVDRLQVPYEALEQAAKDIQLPPYDKLRINGILYVGEDAVRRMFKAMEQRGILPGQGGGQ